VSERDESADRSDVGHPRSTGEFFGHGEAERALLEAYRSARIPHAWLIGGSPGIGKATLAYRLARFVLAHPDPAAEDVQSATSLAIDADHTIARRIAAQGHTDLLALERVVGDKGKLKTTIAVDQIRMLVPFFGSTAGEGGWRVAIVDAVDDLNEAGENALLKLLEEPPARSLLLLVTHTPGRVRTTIRSRCRRLMLRPLAGTDVARAVAAAAGRPANDATISEAAEAAEGSVRRALALLEGDELRLRERLLGLLDQLPHVDARALHAFGDAIATADQSVFDAFIDTVNGWMERRLDEAVDRARLARIAEAWEKVNAAAGETRAYNLDRRPLIFNTFGALAEATRG
jgi:DNA polymerase-3 subunit delta'